MTNYYDIYSIFENQEFKSVLKVDYDESKSFMKKIKCIQKNSNLYELEIKHFIKIGQEMISMV